MHNVDRPGSGMNTVSTADVEQPFARAVCGALLTNDVGQRKRGDELEPLAQPQADVSHLPEVQHASLVQPTEQLARAVGPLVQAAEEFL